jgi:hypothetical protein
MEGSSQVPPGPSFPQKKVRGASPPMGSMGWMGWMGSMGSMGLAIPGRLELEHIENVVLGVPGIGNYSIRRTNEQMYPIRSTNPFYRMMECCFELFLL